jgi:hypothetical protein
MRAPKLTVGLAKSLSLAIGAAGAVTMAALAIHEGVTMSSDSFVAGSGHGITVTPVYGSAAASVGQTVGEDAGLGVSIVTTTPVFGH